jgi:hypothetical protein
MRQHERRREARVTARGVRARVRPGHTLAVVDVSAGGALVEASCQLRPGARIDVHLENDDRRETVGARVTRCAVATIDATTGITYRAALCFVERCEWVREGATLDGYGLPPGPTRANGVLAVEGEPLPRVPENVTGNKRRGLK